MLSRNAEFNAVNRGVYIADNLDFLRDLNTASVDLVCIDPPFAKNDTFTGDKLRPPLRADERENEERLLSWWGIATPEQADDAGIAWPDDPKARGGYKDTWAWDEDIHEDWVNNQLPLLSGLFPQQVPHRRYVKQLLRQKPAIGRCIGPPFLYDSVVVEAEQVAKLPPRPYQAFVDGSLESRNDSRFVVLIERANPDGGFVGQGRTHGGTEPGQRINFAAGFLGVKLVAVFEFHHIAKTPVPPPHEYEVIRLCAGEVNAPRRADGLFVGDKHAVNAVCQETVKVGYAGLVRFRLPLNDVFKLAPGPDASGVDTGDESSQIGVVKHPGITAVPAAGFSRIYSDHRSHPKNCRPACCTAVITE